MKRIPNAFLISPNAIAGTRFTFERELLIKKVMRVPSHYSANIRIRPNENKNENEKSNNLIYNYKTVRTRTLILSIMSGLHYLLCYNLNKNKNKNKLIVTFRM